MESTDIACPICGQHWNLNGRFEPGARTFCRLCWALLEIRSTEPPEAVKLRLQAEDFGI